MNGLQSIIALQNVNPGHGTFGKPYHTYLPDWFAIVLIIFLIITSGILYVNIRRNSKKALTKDVIEKKPLKVYWELHKKTEMLRKAEAMVLSFLNR